MEGEDVPVSVESSWTVLEGSLESCVSVVFLDPETHEPIISSSPHTSTKLVLVPPAEPSPCEITVKFQGRLCHVQSLYTSSTARICEIYSRSYLETDPEYVCTVKGWIPCNDDSSSDNGTENNLEEETTKSRDEVLLEGTNCSGGVEKGLMSSGVSSTAVSHHDVDDECQKSVYSSGEDSWVNVKLNGSFSAESACASLMAPDLDNWHVPLNVEELVHLEDQLGMASPGLEAKKKGLENAVKLSDKSCDGKASIEQGSACLEMFEAEVELVDHNPWAAITIRLLSLQDKTMVEVDQMVFLALSGPVSEPAASAGQFGGREPTSALYAMFLPSIIQMTREVSGSSKDLLKFETSSQLCEQKQDIVPLPLAGKGAGLEGVPELKSATTNPQVQKVSSYTELEGDQSTGAERYTELEGDQSSLPESDANKNATIKPGNQTLPTCNCKEFVGNMIGKELTTTLEAFSERFDRLESLCLRMESFLHTSFECLDQRIRRLEEEHTRVSGETDSTREDKRSDVSIMQSHLNNCPIGSQLKEEALSALPVSAVQDQSPMQHQNGNQIRAGASLSDQSESQEQVEFTSMESDHSEMQHVVKEVSHVDGVNSISADSEEVVNEACTKIKLSREPEVMVVNTASKDKFPHVSLDDAWASALSAFASSFPPVRCGTEDAAHHDNLLSKSHYSTSLKGKGDGSSPSSYPDLTALINGAGNNVVDTSDEQIHGVCEVAVSHEQISIIQEGWDILPPNHSMTSKPVMTFDLFPLDDTMSNPDQKLAAEIDCARSVDSVEGQDILLPSHAGLQEPVSAFDFFLPKEVQSTSGDLNAASSQVLSQQEARPPSLQLGVFSSARANPMLVAEALDAALKSPSYTYSVDNPETGSFNLSAGNSEYDFFQEIAASNPHASRQRAFPSLNAERIEEESLCNASSELDLLSGHNLSEQGQGSSTDQVQDSESFTRSFMYCTTEDANSFPNLLDDNSSNYEDGRTCSQDSLCFSQDFEACQNDSTDTRWSCAPSIFYLHDPELTDDEADNVAAALDERMEPSDSSDVDSLQDFPIWPAPPLFSTDGFQNKCT